MNPQKHIFLWNASYIAGSPRHFSVIIHRHSEVDVLPSVLGTWIFGRCHCSNLEANMFPAGKGENASQVRTISKTALQKDGQEVMPSPTLSFREEENPNKRNPTQMGQKASFSCGRRVGEIFEEETSREGLH